MPRKESDKSRGEIGTAMEPERVRAYLQAACSGLGFDVGEVWWTSGSNGASSVAAIGECLLLG